MPHPIADRLPIIDLHCDLLVYLTDVPGASPGKVEEIGCAIPALTQGNVKLQVMALYTPTEFGSTRHAGLQRDMFRRLAQTEADCLLPVTSAEALHRAFQAGNSIGMVAAIENASGFCEEAEPLEEGFRRLEQIIADCGRVLYISFTHHTANRFGGGNMTTRGITRDGRMLLDYLHGRRIAVDLSHTSDALACDILHHIDTERLDIRLIASHSNFRSVWAHNRNLPDELVQEIIRRRGLIGMNFLRAFLHTDDPDALLHHILYGFNQGAQDVLCFGADYFYTADHPDPARFPFYHKAYEQAGGSYKYILDRLEGLLSKELLEKLAFRNASRFIGELWA